MVTFTKTKYIFTRRKAGYLKIEQVESKLAVYLQTICYTADFFLDVVLGFTSIGGKNIMGLTYITFISL